jgi:hypothetical protein
MLPFLIQLLQVLVVPLEATDDIMHHLDFVLEVVVFLLEEGAVQVLLVDLGDDDLELVNLLVLLGDYPFLFLGL